MSANRRDFVKFAGGAAVGVMATPVPWKLLDDTAIWTQNWASIPKLPRGPLETRTSVCTLCGAGCGLKASLVGGVPVGLSGRLCPTGLAGHQLPWHPFRLKAGTREMEASRSMISKAIASASKPIAILDGRPGRTASRMFRQALASWPNGVYITTNPIAVTGVDLERIETVVGFGAPLMEGGAQLAPGKRVVQVDARHSLTASLAEKWYTVKPGSEGQVSLALARRLMKPADVPSALAGINAQELALDAGLEAAQFEELAELFAAGNAYAAGVNAELLNRVACSALIEKRPVPDVSDPEVSAKLLSDVEPASLGVLIVDATALDVDVSPRMLRSLVAKDGLLVILAAFGSSLTEAGIAVPSAAPFEAWADVVSASYSVAAPLLAPPEGCVAPADFVAQLAGSAANLSKEIEARAGAIHASRRGTIGKPVAQMDGKEVWEALSSGTPWVDDKAPARKTAALPAFVQTRWTGQDELPLALIAFRTSEMPVHQAQPPALTKIYQESELRPAGGTVRMHPETADSAKLKDGQLAVIRTRDGECHATVRIDRLVQRGVLEAPLSPTRAELAGKERPSVPHLLDLTRGAAVVAARIERA